MKISNGGNTKFINFILSSSLPCNTSFLRIMKHDVLLPHSKNSSRKIIPSNYIIIDPHSEPMVRKSIPISFDLVSRTRVGFSTLIRSFLSVISVPAFRWLNLPSQLSLTPSMGRKVTGTLFGNRRGLVSFAVQYDPRSPVLIIELAVSTATLVKEMSSGLVRIALECEKQHSRCKLFNEPRWIMYCNGKKCGHATSRVCSDSDLHVLSTVQSVSVGAGVIPMVEGGRKNDDGSEGELLYMRAMFERVVGSRDSEAYYMMNPDGTGGPELSIFLLRI